MKNDIWHVTQAQDVPDDLLGEPGGRSPLLDAKVMMVDDEPLMTALIETHLQDGGYTNFVTTNNPLEALELLRREQPGVLLLDLMMPGLSGFELLEAIRKDRDLRYTPVIVLTASTGADSKLRALQLGATDFLSKPVDASELVLRVRNTLAFRQYTHRMVNYDNATDLPLAPLFERGVEALLAEADVGAGAEGLVALFTVELPDCRLLRESLGLAAADQLARVAAHRMQRFVERENPWATDPGGADGTPRVARLAHDQFGLVMEGLADADAVEAAAKRLLHSVAEPVTLGAHEVGPTAWIGIAMAPADGERAEDLRKSADLAASHARQPGGAQIQFASPALNRRTVERLTLGSQLRGAAQRGELRVYYQPKVAMDSGRIVGAEALVRWQHPELGLLAPARFIPLAEELGLIGMVGQWVMETACRDAATWSQAGLGALSIAINVAKPQFLGGGLARQLRQAVFDAGLAPEQVVVELTESMLMDDVDGAIAMMDELKALGVTLSIDDFGTGYSSLSYLKRFPLDELKIDRSFVIDLPGRNADEAIVRHIVELGHGLGMAVTAEGIETAEQRDCLRRVGCDRYQGFLYSRPVPVSAFEALLRRQSPD